MFGWRKRQIANKVDNNINYSQPVDEIQAVSTPVVKNKDALYTIGLNQAGNTQLVVKIDYTTATLTMAPDAVRQLIRQLEATLEEESK